MLCYNSHIVYDFSKAKQNMRSYLVLKMRDLTSCWKIREILSY